MKPEERIRLEQAPLPDGLAVRCDALLHRLTAEGEVKMKKKLSAMLVCVIVLIVLAIGMAIAADLGVFGQLADETHFVYWQLNGERIVDRLLKMDSMATPHSMDYEIAADANGFDAIVFSMTQSYYDGDSLYVAYKLAPCFAKAEFMAVQNAEGMHWDILPVEERALLAKWEQWLQPSDYALLQSQLAETGKALFTYHVQYIYPAFYSKNSVITGNLNTTKRLDHGDLLGFFGTTFYGSSNKDDSLALSFMLRRCAYICYIDETGTYFKQYKPMTAHFLDYTIPRGANAEILQGAGLVDENNTQATVWISPLIVRVGVVTEIQYTLEEWSGPDFDGLYKFNLYADGQKYEPWSHYSDWDSGKEGSVLWSLKFNSQESYSSLVLRPVYTISGEHPEWDIVIQ